MILLTPGDVLFILALLMVEFRITGALLQGLLLQRPGDPSVLPSHRRR